MTLPPDGVSLTAGRLHLRPFEPGDAPEVLAACSDPEVARWTTVPSPYTGEDARAFVEDVVPAGWASGTTAAFAVLHATTARLLAGVSLLGIADGSAEVGYWTAPEARGHGYTAEAVGAVCRWGFGALDLQRVQWRAEVGNWGSRAVAESCGFTVEGTLRQSDLVRGRRVDDWHGSLLATDEQVDRRAFGGGWTDLPGEGLLLRRWREDDLDVVVAALSDPQSARFLDVPVPYTAEAGRAWLDTTRHRWAAGVAAPVCVEVDGAAAGLLVLLPSRLDAGTAELGWWTAPGARGTGLTARAVHALLPWAASLGVVRLEALVDPENVASLRVAERAGMAREGVRRAGLRPQRGGPREDALVLSLVLSSQRREAPAAGRTSAGAEPAAGHAGGATSAR